MLVWMYALKGAHTIFQSSDLLFILNLHNIVGQLYLKNSWEKNKWLKKSSDLF